MHFLRNHQEKSKKSASYQQITTKSTVNYKLLTVNYKRPYYFTLHYLGKLCVQLFLFQSVCQSTHGL